MQLAGKTALVTGGAQGIGAAVAYAYAREGARVGVLDVNGAAAAMLASEIGELGGEAVAVRCDVTSRADVDAAVTDALRRFGSIDILVNNAGVIRPAMLARMGAAQWDEVLSVHLTGSFHCLQAVAPVMIDQQRGRVINVTSTAGLLGSIGQVNYAAAKAGIVGLTLAAARELARYGITVNAIAPAAATAMTDTIRNEPRFRDQYLARIPLGRWAEPAEIAPVFVFFASDAASYVTGQVLAADGGMTMR